MIWESVRAVTPQTPLQTTDQNPPFNQIFKEVGLPVKVLEALIPRPFVLKQRFLQPPPHHLVFIFIFRIIWAFGGTLQLENYSFRFFPQLLPCSLRRGSLSQKQVKKMGVAHLGSLWFHRHPLWAFTSRPPPPIPSQATWLRLGLAETNHRPVGGVEIVGILSCCWWGWRWWL